MQDSYVNEQLIHHDHFTSLFTPNNIEDLKKYIPFLAMNVFSNRYSKFNPDENLKIQYRSTS